MLGLTIQSDLGNRVIYVTTTGSSNYFAASVGDFLDCQEKLVDKAVNADNTIQYIYGEPFQAVSG